MKWRQATLSQLHEIAFHDKECNPRYKIEAMAEIKRRNRMKFNTHLQCKMQRKRA